MESSGTSYALQITLHQTRYTTHFIGTTNIGKAKIFFSLINKKPHCVQFSIGSLADFVVLTDKYHRLKVSDVEKMIKSPRNKWYIDTKTRVPMSFNRRYISTFLQTKCLEDIRCLEIFHFSSQISSTHFHVN